MLYFIPSWYNDSYFREKEQYWFIRRLETEFDDSVKQIQLFNRNKISDFKILLLSYVPNFRHFLHRQSVFHAPYWSCFDAIQEVERQHVSVLSFHDLLWPEHVEFIDSPFCIIAMVNQKKYAEIQFAEDGNMIEVDLFEGTTICRKNIYDDRGFLSSTIIYEQGKPFYEQYLNPSGTWKCTYFFDDHHIEVNPKSSYYLISNHKVSFQKLSYISMDELIQEVFQTFVKENIQSQDIFCLAMHPLHNALLENTLKQYKKICSFYQKRCDLSNDAASCSLLNESNYIVVDSQKKISHIKNFLSNSIPIIDITPFDTRIDFGISQQLTVQNILVPVDYLTKEMFEALILQFLSYLEKNDNARIHFFTRKANWNIEDCLLEEIQTILKRHEVNPNFARKKETNYAENDLDEEKAVPILFYIDQCVDELAISKTIRKQRILLDFSDHPDLYLLISCISAGIPMILKKETQYMEDHKNGLLISSVDEIPSSLSFYLDNLNEWNKALIASYEIGKKYNTKQLILKWKEVMNAVGKN